MRNAFVDEITKISKKDKKIIILAGDIGYKLYDNFKIKYPNRFYNCGVAEANMTTVAAGLALMGSSRPIFALVGVGLILVLSLPFLLFAFVTTLLNRIRLEPKPS